MPGPVWTLRLAREHLIFKALCALDEAIDQAKDGPVAPSFALRFALAFLFACSDGRREPYDGFWRVVRDPYDGAYSETQRRYLRPTYARTQLRGILQSLGLEGAPELETDILVARGIIEDRRPQLAEAKRRIAEQIEATMEEDRRRLAYNKELNQRLQNHAKAGGATGHCGSSSDSG